MDVQATFKKAEEIASGLGKRINDSCIVVARESRGEIAFHVSIVGTLGYLFVNSNLTAEENIESMYQDHMQNAVVGEWVKLSFFVESIEGDMANCKADCDQYKFQVPVLLILSRGEI